MIFGVGTDIIEIQRIKKACEKQSFFNKCFTDKEIEYFKNHNFMAETMAGSFAAKESVVKALKVGFGNIKAVDIEIFRDEKGAPYVVFGGNALNFALENKITKINISISHCVEYAVAYAVAEVD